MGQIYRMLGLDVGVVIPEIDDYEAKRQAYAAGITYGTNNEFGFDYLRDNMAVARDDQVQTQPRVRNRRRGRLHPHRRGPHAAHHLGSRRRRPGAVRPVRGHRQEPEARRRLRGRRGEAHGRAHRGRCCRGREGARRRQPVREHQPELRAPTPSGAARQGAVQERRRLRHPGRRSQDRRRIHRAHPRGQAVVRRTPSGGGGEGAGEDQGGEPDPRHDHAPELLPHVRQAQRHDGHRVHRGGGVRAHLRARRRLDPHQPDHGPARRARPHLQDGGREVRCRGRRHRRAPRPGPAGAGGHDLGREVGAALPTAREARHPARGAEREAARAGGARRHPGRASRCGHRRHQHGRARRRHPSRGQPRGPRPAGAAGQRHHGGGVAGEVRRARRAVQGRVRGARRRGASTRRSLRARHRAPREPPHRQPAARPVRSSGRPR